MQRVQRRRGKQPSKIDGDETENSDDSEEKISASLGDIAEETETLGEAQRNNPRRGRPAKRGKSSVGQTQRVQRLRRGKKPSTIGGGDESEENDDFDDKNEEEETANAEESRSVQNDETREPDITKYTEPVRRDNTEASEVSQDSRNEKKTEMDMKEKLQIHEDPVQAMLMNMIPSLGMKNTETSNREASVSGEYCESSEKRKLDAETVGSSVNAFAEADAVPPPVKKKKVSYRDVTRELLKDW